MAMDCQNDLPAKPRLSGRDSFRSPLAALSASPPRQISRRLEREILGRRATAKSRQAMPVAACGQRRRSESAGADSEAVGKVAPRLGLRHLDDNANRLSPGPQEIRAAHNLLLPARFHLVGEAGGP